MTVYLVRLFTTGEAWHTFVCKDKAVVESALKRGYSMEPLGDGMWYQNPKDHTQTALVSPTNLVEA